MREICSKSIERRIHNLHPELRQIKITAPAGGGPDSFPRETGARSFHAASAKIKNAIVLGRLCRARRGFFRCISGRGAAGSAIGPEENFHSGAPFGSSVARTGFVL